MAAGSAPGSIRLKMTLTSPMSTTFSRSSGEKTRSAILRALAIDGVPLDHRLVLVGVDREAVIGRWQPVRDDPPRCHDEADDHDRDHRQDPWRIGDRVGPRRVLGYAEDARLDEVRRVELRDVDPPLLRQLDEDPDERRDADQQVRASPARVPSCADRLVGVEEVLERVREDQQDRPDLRLLEQHDPSEPVVEEEPADVEPVAADPVPERRQVRQREVVHVERLVVLLVARQVEMGDGLEDRLVEPVDDERRQHDRERESEDTERHQDPSADHNPEDDRVGRDVQGRPPMAGYRPTQGA
jgi:hypothetical protein